MVRYHCQIAICVYMEKTRVSRFRFAKGKIVITIVLL